MIDLSLYVLVDRARAGNKPLDQIAAAAARGGASLIQLRDKEGETRALIETALALKHALAGKNIPLIMNDRVDAALAANVDGVHLGRDDMDARTARRLLGPRAIIGATVKDESDAAELAIGAVDYVCVGGVFATSSKHNPDPPIGIEGLRRLLQKLHARTPQLPVGAIAGINEANAADVIRAGADGIAVASAVIAAPDPEAAARRLKAIVARAKAERGGTR
jgi:thiamine-phosphate pyrophosphorylase